MIVRRYLNEDFPQIKDWGEEWGSVYREEQFPVYGFIIDGVGAYFLYSTDSSVCWLENLITKRGLDLAVKARAIDLLVDACLREAKAQEFTVAYATTDNLKLLKRAREKGASISPTQFLITKDLVRDITLQ